MSKETLKTGCSVISVNPLTKYIRSIYSSKEGSLSWNLSLPFRIGIKGTIKESLKRKVLDDVRNSYGIDFTANIKIDKDSVEKEKEALKEKINELTRNAKPSTSYILDNCKNKLAKLNRVNNTYATYCIRKNKFNYSKLEKTLAAFLLVTGQVKYNAEKEKFVFEIGNNSSFNLVRDFKSFNALESFNQKIFEKTYYINAENAKILKKTGCSISEYLQKNKDVLNSSDLKFNKMYKSYVLTKVKKMYPLLKKKDVKGILKSLYEFRVNLVDDIERNKKETEQNNLKDFSNKIGEAIKSSPIERKKQKKALVDSFIKCFPKTKLGKREVNAFIDTLMSIFDGLLREVEKNYIKKEEVEKNYVKRCDIEKEYIKKEEVEKNYIKKEEVEKNYIKKEEVEKNYVKRCDIEKEYIKKEEVEKNYVTKEEYNKLMLKCDKLQKTVDELRAKLDKVTSNG